MHITHSQLSPIQMITALETIQLLLENYPCSLNGYEKTALLQFAISLAENMENKLEGPIIISLSSAMNDATMASRAQRRLRVANNALSSLLPGDWGKYCSARSNNHQPLTSPGMSLKNGQTQTTLEEDTLPSHE